MMKLERMCGRAAIAAAFAIGALPFAAGAEDEKPEGPNPFNKPEAALGTEAPKAPRPESRSKGEAQDPQEIVRRMTAMDASGDGGVTPDEFEGPAKQFTRGDANSDGKLDKTEIEALAVEMVSRKGPMGRGMKGPKPEEILKTLDKNADGKIARDEADGPMKENFDRLDANKDGQIEAEEMKKMMAREGRGPEGRGPEGPGGGPPSPEGILERLDKNADGKVQKDEAQGPIERVFDEIDGNKDGAADKEELTAWTGKMRERQGRRGRGGLPPTDELIKHMDANADGKIARDEAQGPIAERFDKMDGDKDGALTAAEVDAARAKMAEREGDRPGRPGKGERGKGKRPRGEGRPGPGPGGPPPEGGPDEKPEPEV